MTTIVAVKKNGVAVIAADSLTTFGEGRIEAQFDASYDKILRVGDSYMGICGSAAHYLVLEHMLTRRTDLLFTDKRTIFESFRKLHPVLKEEHFLNPKEDEEDPYESSQITALIANPQGIFGVYSMREVFEYTQFWAIGTGREFALGAMFAAYNRCDSAEEVARVGIETGAMFDKNTALPMTIYSINLQDNQGT